MAEIDHGIKLIADIASRELARIAGIECQRLQPMESTLPATTELLADRAFLASQGRERFLLYFEFLTRWDPGTPWDLLAKSGLLSHREHLPTVCLAFCAHSARLPFARGATAAGGVGAADATSVVQGDLLVGLGTSTLVGIRAGPYGALSIVPAWTNPGRGDSACRGGDRATLV